jgi:ethanolamine utilization protein EutP (predicted NTPase)
VKRNYKSSTTRAYFITLPIIYKALITLAKNLEIIAKRILSLRKKYNSSEIKA